jgi:toxin HigB-1
VIDGFEHKGLEELYLTGKTRRIGADCSRKCIRILQLLVVSTRPEDMNVAGSRRWSVRVTANYRITFGWTGKLLLP